MDCNQAELFIMQHFEKTIKPVNASSLAKHVLTCEVCRMLYLTFDEAMDCVGELEDAPDNFVESVMTRVMAEEAHSRVVTIVTETNSGGSFVLRILWGFSAVLLGIGLLFALNPDLLYTLVGEYPMVASVANALYSINVVFVNAAEWVAQESNMVSMENLGVASLLLVAVMGTLLYVLHSGESDVKT